MSVLVATPTKGTKSRRKAVAVSVTKQEPLRIAGLQAQAGEAIASLDLSLTMLKMAYEAANNEAGSYRVLADTPANRDKCSDLLSGGKARKLYNDLRGAKQPHKNAMTIVTQMFKARKALANRFADEIKTLEFDIKSNKARLAK